MASSARKTHRRKQCLKQSLQPAHTAAWYRRLSEKHKRLTATQIFHLPVNVFKKLFATKFHAVWTHVSAVNQPSLGWAERRRRSVFHLSPAWADLIQHYGTTGTSRQSRHMYEMISRENTGKHTLHSGENTSRYHGGPSLYHNDLQFAC